MEENSKVGDVYGKVAKEALMNWNGLTEEQANEELKKPFSEVDGQVWAQGSMNSALESIKRIAEKKGLGITDEEMEEFKNAVYHEGEDAEIFKTIREKTENGIEENDVVTILSDIHDQWVKDNPKKFLQEGRNRQYQHMPIELIGWKESTSDLLFVKPILESMGKSINEQDLEQAYNDRVKTFLDEKGINSLEQLEQAISKGKDFYPALQGQEEISEKLAEDTQLVEKIAGDVSERGIGEFIEKDSLAKLYEKKQELLKEEATLNEQINEKDGQNQEL